MHAPVLRLGLTGGIGSGKSTVAHTLVACGAALIDADAISRKLTATGGGAIQKLARQFGPKIITPDGAMDRDQMRQLAFGNPGSKAQLEAIIHPLVSLEAAHLTRRAVEAGHSCIVFDIPLLVESGRWRQQLDRVLVVDCMEETQVRRVMARNAFSRAMVEKIMAGQASRAQRLAAADACICNEGVSLDDLRQRVRQWAAGFIL